MELQAPLTALATVGSPGTESHVGAEFRSVFVRMHPNQAGFVDVKGSYPTLAVPRTH